MSAVNEASRLAAEALRAILPHSPGEPGYCTGPKCECFTIRDNAKALESGQDGIYPVAYEQALKAISKMSDSCGCSSVESQPDHDAHCPVGVALAALKEAKP